MNGLELLKKHPKITEILRQWQKEQMIKSAGEVTMDPQFEEMVKTWEVDDKMLSFILENNPRAFLGALDDNGVYVFIIPEIHPLDKHVMFNYVIHFNSVGLAKGEEDFAERRQVEDVALEVAFGILEEKLSVKAQKT